MKLEIIARLKAVSDLVKRQIYSVLMTQPMQSSCRRYPQYSPSSAAQLRSNDDGSIVRKADKTGVKGSIPQSREQETIVYIQALLI